MRIPVAVFMVMTFVFMLAQGCSHETQNDMKRDVNDAARKVDNSVKDAMD